MSDLSCPTLFVDWGTSPNGFPVLSTTGTMIRRERLGVCATLPLARTLSRFDAGFTVPVWRDARLDFDEAAFDTLMPVELTVTRIMLTPCSDRSRHSLLARGSIRRPSKSPSLTLPSDQMGYGGSLGREDIASAARSIGSSASLCVSVCHPSTLRMVI